MNVLETINHDLHDAMKNSNKPIIETLRGVKTEFMKFEKSETNVGKVLNDSDYIAIMQKLGRQRLDSAEIYKNAGRTELAEKELIEYDIISKYVPAQMTEVEVTEYVNKKITETGLNHQKDFGQLMKMLTVELKGKTDGKVISTILKSILT